MSGRFTAVPTGHYRISEYSYIRLLRIYIIVHQSCLRYTCISDTSSRQSALPIRTVFRDLSVKVVEAITLENPSFLLSPMNSSQVFRSFFPTGIPQVVSNAFTQLSNQSPCILFRLRFLCIQPIMRISAYRMYQSHGAKIWPCISRQAQA